MSVLMLRLRLFAAAAWTGFVDDDAATAFIDDAGATSFIDDAGTVGG